MRERGPLVLDRADVAIARQILDLDGREIRAQAVLGGVVDGGAAGAGVASRGGASPRRSVAGRLWLNVLGGALVKVG